MLIRTVHITIQRLTNDLGNILLPKKSHKRLGKDSFLFKKVLLLPFGGVEGFVLYFSSREITAIYNQDLSFSLYQTKRPCGLVWVGGKKGKDYLLGFE